MEGRKESVRLTFLGTGTSQGVPIIGCQCNVCKSPDWHDRRLRAAALVEIGGLTIAVDAGPDFRYQMLRAGVRDLDAILLTHNHKDHTGGLDDVRAFNWLSGGKPTQIYCEDYVRKSLMGEYPYVFASHKYPGAPEWNIHLIDERPFTVKSFSFKPRYAVPPEYLGKSADRNNDQISSTGTGKTTLQTDSTVKAGKNAPGQTGSAARARENAPGQEHIRKAEIIPIRGMHYKLPVLGFRFGDIAYCTDMNFIPESEFEKLRGLEHFVINTVKRGPHISHFSLEEAIAVARRVGARHSWLTHLSHQLPRYEALRSELSAELHASVPLDIRPAYDGLVITSGL